MIIELLTAHFIADYPLQGDFLSKAKNHKTPITGFPFQHALLAHSAIHGGLVSIITGIWWLGLLELIIHGATDYLKCDNKISIHQDQLIHVLCKILWALIALAAGGQ